MRKEESPQYNLKLKKTSKNGFKNINLIDVTANNGKYKWHNRRIGFNNIAEKLDGFSFKGNLGSDHFTVALEIEEEITPRRCAFKFERMRLLDPEVIGLVEEWWKKEVVVGSECNALILS